jgi:stage II sporulation protein D
MKSANHAAYLFLLLFLISIGLVGNPSQEQAAAPSPSFEQAVRFYYAGEFESSVDAFRRRVRHDNSDSLSRIQLVRLLKEAGEMQEALEHLHILNAAAENDQFSLELLKTGILADSGVNLDIESASNTSGEALFWYALGVLREGKSDTAKELLKRSLLKDDYNPGANYFLGLIAKAQQEYPAARDHLMRALKQEPNLTMVLVPLAQTVIAQGAVDEGYRLLLRAGAALPENPEVAQEMRQLVERYPHLAEKKEQKSRERRIAARTPQKEHLPSGMETLPVIRIGLAEGIDILHLKTGASFTLRTTEKLYLGEAGEILTITYSPDRVRISGDTDDTIMENSDPVILDYEIPGTTTALFDMEYGGGYYYAGSEDRFYRGQMEFLPTRDGLTIVNQVSLEEYLYSVVPSEIPAYWPKEALEAQAIAARSYTLANMGRFASRGFDLMGSVRSASYRGAGNEAERTTSAVDATWGKVLVHNGKALDAVYSANSGGYTESGESVWGYPSPLRAVNDPKLSSRTEPLPPDSLARWLTERPESFSSEPGFHSAAAYRWKMWVSAEEISARLASRGYEIGRIISLTSRGRGISGRVEKVLVQGTDEDAEVRGDSIRSVLGGLRSNLFISEAVLGADGLPESFLFTGGGWGHGVGMDQSGAAGMAAQGWSAEEILAHYYPEAVIEDISSLITFSTRNEDKD